MIWNTVEKNLGEVKSCTNLQIIFEGDSSDNIGVKRIKTSCGCTKAIFNKKTNQVTINYKTKPIPYHLLNQGWYKVTKSIIVIDTNNKETKLSFTVKIIK